jgi:hypothetical protein
LVNDGLFYRSREADTCHAKSSVQEDLFHVLTAIVEGLDEHLSWPDENHRHELDVTFSWHLSGCIGVCDVKEYEIEKPKDCTLEKSSWRGGKISSHMMLSVMEHTDHYIFHHVCLGKNDIEGFTGSPLYLHEGEFFSDNQWVLSDGAFDRDGQFICSDKNPGNEPDKIPNNLAFFEVRQGVENSYGKV